MKNMVLIHLILIAAIVVFIVDISGAVDSLKSGLKWILTGGKMKDSNYDLKPFSCSLCMTFWVGIIYLFCTGNFTLPYFGFVCFLSCFSGIIKSTILLVEDIIIKIIQLIYKLIEGNENNNIQ